MYRTIRRAAYALDPDAAPWTEDYRVLAYPEQWHDGPLELCNFGRDAETRLRTVPTRRFDGVLQTLAPDLIVRPRPRPPQSDAPAPEEDFWLYAPCEAAPPLPGPAMAQLLDAWLRTLGPRGSAPDPRFRALLLRTSAELKEHLPTWREARAVDLLGAAVTEGGTAAPAPRQYQLAGDALARRILSLDPLEYQGGNLRFRAAPRGPKEQGAELISQPLHRTVKRKEWWFSITLNITLHTTPFDPRPRLHLHWGVRRWATHPQGSSGRLRLPFRTMTSVYLLPGVPWLSGAPASDRYAIARLVHRRDRDAFEWLHNDPAGILHQLSLGRRFPAPELLLGDPASWIGEGPGVRAAVAHSTRMGVHEIGTGLMPHQVSEFTSWAEQALPEGLVRLRDLERRGRGAGAPANRRPKPNGAAKKAEEARAANARRLALAAAVSGWSGSAAPESGSPVIETRLLWQTAELRRQAVASFAELLGLDGGQLASLPEFSEQTFEEARPGSPVVLEWRTPELVLRLRCLPLNQGLGEGLHSMSAGRTVRTADAILVRRREVAATLRSDGTDSQHPSLALVEIADRSTFRPARTDPKFAIRLGCADAGVLTQFAVSPETRPAKGRKVDDNQDSDLEHRVRNAWLDGLRQMGVRVLPEHTLDGELPDGLRYAALWMVKRRKDGPTRLPKHLPVAVLATPAGTGDGLARIEGWDHDARRWIPYPSFLLGLVKKAEIDLEDDLAPDPLIPAQRGESPDGAVSKISARRWRANLEEQRRDTASFVQSLLHSLQGRPTVLITHAQNSRLHWPWLQDGRVVRDLLKTGHAPAGRLYEGLRLIRVRGRAGRETAQWWGVAEPGEANGQPAGFWAAPGEGVADACRDRVFYSATSRPQSHPVSPSLDRLALRTTAAGRLTSQAGTSAWNPALVEIAVLGCFPDGNETGKPDEPEALALAMHQLRQAPDYPDALSLPLPLHLAGLAQAYVLPMFSDGESEDDHDDGGGVDARGDRAADLDPDLVEPTTLADEPEEQEQLTLF